MIPPRTLLLLLALGLSCVSSSAAAPDPDAAEIQQRLFDLVQEARWQEALDHVADHGHLQALQGTQAQHAVAVANLRAGNYQAASQALERAGESSEVAYLGAAVAAAQAIRALDPNAQRAHLQNAKASLYRAALTRVRESAASPARVAWTVPQALAICCARGKLTVTAPRWLPPRTALTRAQVLQGVKARFTKLQALMAQGGAGFESALVDARTYLSRHRAALTTDQRARLEQGLERLAAGMKLLAWDVADAALSTLQRAAKSHDLGLARLALGDLEASTAFLCSVLQPGCEEAKAATELLSRGRGLFETILESQ